mgnify:CR=1 FL=1
MWNPLDPVPPLLNRRQCAKKLFFSNHLADFDKMYRGSCFSKKSECPLIVKYNVHFFWAKFSKVRHMKTYVVNNISKKMKKEKSVYQKKY